MAKRRAAARKKFEARPRRRRLRVLTLLLVTAVLGAGVTLARRGLFPAAPAPPAQRRPPSGPRPAQSPAPGPSPGSPSKEYIYAGGRLIATEEPTAPPKSDQTITFEQPPDKTYGDAPFALSANSSSGLPVNFTVTSGPASVSGDTVTLAGAGAVSIRADQAGDASFNPAPSVTRTLTVAKATPVITWQTPADIVQGTALGGAQLNATASVAGTFAYTPPAGTVLGVGNGQQLSATFTPADAVNYNGATGVVLINVVGCPHAAGSTFTAVSPIAPGYYSHLSWNVPHATQVTISGVPGTFGATGGVTVYPTAAVTTYTLTAVGAGVCPSAVMLQRVVLVQDCPTAAGTTLTADSLMIPRGASAQLIWSAPNATHTSVLSSGGCPGCMTGLYSGTETGGSLTVSPSGTTEYLLRVEGPAGCPWPTFAEEFAAKRLTIEVVDECSPGSYFYAGPPPPDVITTGDVVVLYYSVPNASSVTITDNTGANYGTFSSSSGAIYVSMFNNRTYTLTAQIANSAACSPYVLVTTYQCDWCEPGPTS